MSDWLPDDAYESLSMERTVNPHESPEELATRLFRENVANATTQIINLAINATNERTRLTASIYVVERVLGRQPDASNGGGGSWDDLLAKCVREERRN